MQIDLYKYLPPNGKLYPKGSEVRVRWPLKVFWYFIFEGWGEASYYRFLAKIDHSKY